MDNRTAGSFLALSLCVILCSPLADAVGQPPKPAQLSVNELSMEVGALQALRQFDFSTAQLEKLRKLAAETASDVGARQAAKASGEFRQSLTGLRNALAEGTDDERIGELEEKVDDLKNTESLELDDGLEVTDAARRRAPEVLGLLSARQLAAYIAAAAEGVTDPLERLLEALGKVRGLDPKEWKNLRDEFSDEVARLIAGLDGEKASQTADKIIQLLIHARALKEAEFKAQRPELEKTARQIVGNISAFDVLRHIAEQSLAEMLSNPRLQAAVDARLKK